MNRGRWFIRDACDFERWLVSMRSLSTVYRSRLMAQRRSFGSENLCTLLVNRRRSAVSRPTFWGNPSLAQKIEQLIYSNINLLNENDCRSSRYSHIVYSAVCDKWEYYDEQIHLICLNLQYPLMTKMQAWGWCPWVKKNPEKTFVFLPALFK